MAYNKFPLLIISNIFIYLFTICLCILNLKHSKQHDFSNFNSLSKIKGLKTGSIN